MAILVPDRSIVMTRDKNMMESDVALIAPDSSMIMTRDKDRMLQAMWP